MPVSISKGPLPGAQANPADPWVEFGEELRRDRELRDVSRQQLASVTKVSMRHIEALESGRFEQLPAPVFARGFVRAIALHLGLDAERSTAVFTHVQQAWTVSQGRPGTTSVAGARGRRRKLPLDTPMLGVVVGAALALATGFAALVKARSTDRPAPPSPAALAAAPDRAETGPASLALPEHVAASTVALPPESPALAVSTDGTTPEAGAGRGPESTGASRTLTLRFHDDCWTEVLVDGKVVAAELFRAGDVRVFSGAGRFALTLGNAGGVEVAVDGRALSAIGSAGQVVKNYVIEEPGREGRRPAQQG